MLTKQILKLLPFSHASSITEAACSISFDCNHVFSTDHTSNIVHKHALFTMPYSLAYLICRETLLLSHDSFLLMVCYTWTQWVLKPRPCLHPFIREKEMPFAEIPPSAVVTTPDY